MDLSDCPLGSHVRITALTGSSAERLRLAELGMTPGAQVTALLSGFGKRRVICLGSQRFGVAPAAAARVRVELLEESRDGGAQ